MGGGGGTFWGTRLGRKGMEVTWGLYGFEPCEKLYGRTF